MCQRLKKTHDGMSTTHTDKKITAPLVLQAQQLRIEVVRAQHRGDADEARAVHLHCKPTIVMGPGKYKRTAETRAKIAASNKRRKLGKLAERNNNFVEPGGKCKHGKFRQCCFTCDPEGTRKRQTRIIKRSYGLEKEEYLELFNKQNYCCPGCLQPIAPYSRTAHVDHDHKTGLVRGILCLKCNSGLGMLNDDTAVLMRLSEYLHAHVCNSGTASQ